jgi:tetratricopeptide (TPR) repeat protein
MISSLKRYLLFFIVSSLLTLITFEVFLQTRKSKKLRPTLSAPAYGIPNSLIANFQTELNFQNKFKSKIITNKKRLRESRSIPYTKPRNTFRILCLGDSILFGPGVKYEESFSHQLETLLNKNFPTRKFEVINAAVSGWSPVEYLIYLKEEGYKFSPDLVLVSKFIDDIDGLRSSRIKFEKLDSQQISDSEILVEIGELKIKKANNNGLTLLLDYLLNNVWLGQLSENYVVFHKIRQRIQSIHLEMSKIKFPKNDSLEKILQKIDPLKDKKITWMLTEANLPDYKIRSIRQLRYDLVIDKLKKYALSIGSRILLLEFPTFQQAYKMVHYDTQNSEFWKNSDEHSLIEGMSNFQYNKDIPLFFPKDSHWTPAGHLFVATAAFNEISKNFLGEINIEYIDIDSLDTIANLKQANKRLDNLLNKYPPKKFIESVVHSNNNRFDEAIESLEQYIQTNPKDPESLFYLGSFYLKIKKPEKAIQFFEKAIQYQKPPLSLAQALFSAGRAYFQLKKYDKAATFFEKTSQFEKFEPSETYNYLAQSYFWSKKYSLAEQNWLKAIQKSPNSIKYYNVLGSFYLETGQMKKALAQFKTVQTIVPENPKSFFLQGLAYLKLNQRQNAQKMFSKVLELEPQNRIALRYLKGLNSYKN